MEKLRSWFSNFMQGRYGFDELGRAMGIATIVLIIVSIVVGVVASLLYNLAHLYTIGAVLNAFSGVANWAAIIVLVLSFFRMFSRNHEKRRAENARFLGRKSARQSKRDLARDKKKYEYLTCQFCGQKMRVPKGKGKIAVKCPACGEKTICNS